MSDPDWLSRTDEQIRTQALEEGERLSGVERGPTVGFLRGIWELVALLVQHTYAIAIRPIADHADPRRATGWYLRLHGILAGAPARAARATSGAVLVTTTTGGTVPAGQVFEIAGQEFTADAEVTIAANDTAAVRVTATVAGDNGNVAAGSAVTMSPDPVPADATARLDAGWLLRYGHPADDPVNDPETYRQRVLAGLDVKGTEALEGRYRLAVAGVPHISSVAIGRTPRGAGSTDLAVLFDGRLPTADELDLVEAAVDEEAIAARDLWVRAPDVVAVSVKAEITGTATVAAVTAAIMDWWRENVGIGAELLVQDLYRDATEAVAGLESILYTSPEKNLAAVASQWYQPAISVTEA